MWHSPWLFLRGLIYNFPCLSVPASKDFLLFPDNIRHILIQEPFHLLASLSGKVIPSNLCVNCFLTSIISQRKSTFIILSLTIYFFFHLPNWCFYYLSPSQDSKNAKANMYHSRDLVKEHMGRIKTGSDLKIRVDYLFSKTGKNKPKKISRLYFSIISPLLS